MNKIPRRIVIIRVVIDILIFFSKKQWCAQVIVAPEDNKIIEFNKGIPIGIKILIPIGGQFLPNSMLGAILLWKKAQKNLLKNITSDTINIIILYFTNFMEVFECPPRKDDSCFTSVHQRKVATVGPLRTNSRLYIEFEFIEIVEINIDTTNSNATDIIKGHGLNAGIKNGFLVLIIFFISELR